MRKIRSMAAPGFSLVELLVAVGIVAVLASLLFPSIQSAIKRSGDGKCVGNLRGFGMIAQQFFVENGYILPYCEFKDKKRIPDTSWIDRLNAIDKAPAVQHICPAAEVKFRLGSDGLAYDTHAGANDGFANYGWSAGILNEAPFLKFGSVATPSQMMIMADTAATVALSHGTLPGSWIVQGPNSIANRDNPSRKNNFGYRHNGRANVLFLDGHVEARLPMETPLTVPKTAESLMFYNGTTL